MNILTISIIILMLVIVASVFVMCSQNTQIEDLKNTLCKLDSQFHEYKIQNPENPVQAAFETWAVERGLLTTKSVAGTYQNLKTKVAWDSWQAAKNI